MPYEIDFKADDPFLEKIFDLIQQQRKIFRNLEYEVSHSQSLIQGLQKFRLARSASIKLLNNYIGEEVAEEFGKLPTQLLAQHPSRLLMDYQYMDWCKNEVEGYSNYLTAIMEQINTGLIELNGLEIQKHREIILRELYEQIEQGFQSYENLITATGLDMYELHHALESLKLKHLVREEKYEFMLTVIGKKEVEKMDKIQPQETPEQKRYRVLRKLYELAPHDKHGEVSIYDLADALGMKFQEASRILIYWEEKNMVSSPSDISVALTPQSIDEIEATINHPNRPTTHFSTSTINYTDNSVNIGGDNLGQAQGGQDNVQNTMNSQPIGEILPKLVELIQAVKQADFEDKDEVVRDLEKVQQLAQSEHPKSKWALIQSKLTSAKTAMELVGFGYKTLPYWPVIWQYFFG